MFSYLISSGQFPRPLGQCSQFGYGYNACTKGNQVGLNEKQVSVVTTGISFSIGM